MQIWQMESYPCGDRRMPHHLFPPKMLTPDQLQTCAGVTYYKVDLDDTAAMKKRMSKVKESCDVMYSDVLTMDENLIEFEQKSALEKQLEAMYEPLEREENTVAMVLEGGMYYDVEFEDEKWVRIHMERGDLIVIPKHTPFRSTTTSKNFVKLQRFAKRPVH